MAPSARVVRRFSNGWLASRQGKACMGFCEVGFILLANIKKGTLYTLANNSAINPASRATSPKTGLCLQQYAHIFL